MAINNTGVPSTEEYLLGRGKMYLADLNSNGTPQSYLDMGNIPEFSVTVDSELYEHFTTRQGLRVKDYTVTIEQTMDLSFIFENVLDFEKLKYFFAGDAEEYTNPATAGVTGAVLAEAGTLKANAFYILTDSNRDSLVSIDTANLTIETTNATPVTLVLDTDYTVDTAIGQVFLKDTLATQTAITNGEGLTFDYTADANAGSSSKLTAQTQTSVTVALRFESIDANNNKQRIYDFHKVTITADGDFNLISDEVAQSPIAGSVEKSEFYDGTLTIIDPGARTD